MQFLKIISGYLPLIMQKLKARVNKLAVMYRISFFDQQHWNDYMSRGFTLIYLVNNVFNHENNHNWALGSNDDIDTASLQKSNGGTDNGTLLNVTKITILGTDFLIFFKQTKFSCFFLNKIMT